MRLTRNGALLVGTQTPWGRMHVSGGSMKLSNAGSHSVLYWVESNDGSADMGMDSGTLRIRTTGGNHPIVFHPGDQGEKMRLLQNGNVGIGTAAPVERLHVNGKVLVMNCVSVVTVVTAGLQVTEPPSGVKMVIMFIHGPSQTMLALERTHRVLS